MAPREQQPLPISRANDFRSAELLAADDVALVAVGSQQGR